MNEADCKQSKANCMVFIETIANRFGKLNIFKMTTAYGRRNGKKISSNHING